MTCELCSPAESNCKILLLLTADRRCDTKVKCNTGRASFWVKFPTVWSLTQVKCPGIARGGWCSPSSNCETEFHIDIYCTKVHVVRCTCMYSNLLTHPDTPDFPVSHCTLPLDPPLNVVLVLGVEWSDGRWMTIAISQICFILFFRLKIPLKYSSIYVLLHSNYCFLCCCASQ